ncbi:MAG TPA: (deoxy)nucleoside triphosphate pyrophosphohydrolase [Pirellulales bacterium]|jgi:mutator protein MutT|nr:(deoxy)nucleoside triphosphate pyrophosphohydrolase [Pirellulales bacterium]
MQFPRDENDVRRAPADEEQPTRSRGDAAERREGRQRGCSQAESQQQIAVAIVEHDGRFLVGVRPPGRPLAGLSEFPGGKVLAGESVAEAAVRECREETGLTIAVGAPLSIVEHNYPHGRLALHFFRCTLLDANRPVPAAPFRWLDPHELAQLEFPEANRAIIRELLRQSAAPGKLER